MKPMRTAPRFFGVSLLYLASSLLSKAVVFLLLPLYTARIPAADMGEMDAAVALAVLLSSVLFLDVGVAVLRFFGAAGEGERGARVLSTGILLVLLATAAYLLVAFLVFWLLGLPHFPFVVLYGLANALFLAAGHIARAVGARMRYALSGVLSALLQAALALVLLLALQMDVRALYIAYTVGALGGAALSISAPTLRRALLAARPDRALLCEMLRFALPLGLSAAAFWVLSSAHRVVVLYAFDEVAAGYFAVSLKFSQIILLVSACFQLVWQEVALARGATEEDSTRADLFLRVAMAALLLLVPLTALLLALFPRFLGEGYTAVAGLLPYALFSSFAAIVATFFEPLLAREGKTGTLLATTAAGACVLTVLTALILLLGGSLAMLYLASGFSFLLVAFARIFLLTRQKKLHLPLLRYWWVVFFFAILTLAYHILTPLWQLASLALALLCAVLLLFPEILLLFGRKSAKNG